jgi:hypothetical protein
VESSVNGGLVEESNGGGLVSMQSSGLGWREISPREVRDKERDAGR